MERIEGIKDPTRKHLAITAAQYLRQEGIREEKLAINKHRLSILFPFCIYIIQNDKPFYLPPLSVAQIVLDYNQDEAAMLGALLHDTVEDTQMLLAAYKNSIWRRNCWNRR